MGSGQKISGELLLLADQCCLPDPWPQRRICPLWVISGHVGCVKRSPLYPLKQTLLSLVIDVRYVPIADIVDPSTACIIALSAIRCGDLGIETHYLDDMTNLDDMTETGFESPCTAFRSSPQ